jgi:outer membrane protein assembly factor BamB
MKKLAAVGLLACGLANGQGRPMDWPSVGNDAQRTGWEKVDARITKDSVKDFRLVLKRKLEASKGILTPPVVLGLLISYKGFKELGFVQSNSGDLWAIDLDVDKIFWHRHLGNGTGVCAGNSVAAPALTPPINFAAPRPRPITPGNAVAPAEYVPAPRPIGRAALTGGGFGSPRPLFVVAGDGKIHLLNTSTGEESIPAMDFLPADAKASSLTMLEGTVYAATTDGCQGTQNGIWAINLTGGDPKEPPVVSSFPLNGGGVSGLGEMAFGLDGTVYVQTGPGENDPSSNKWSNTLLALSPKELKLKEYFTVPTPGNAPVVTPVVFSYQSREFVATAGTDGGLYLLDAKSPGGSDHKTPVAQTPPVAAPGGKIWGGLSTWQEADGTRWILAPVWGGVNPELKLTANGAAPNGSIVAFKIEEHEDKLSLIPAWMSCDMRSPQPPVITSGVVFALAAGGPHATLYAFEGATGKEMYSTGDQITAPANLTGITLANGRVLLSTVDNTLYGFGIYLER